MMDRVVIGGNMRGSERLVYKMVETLTCSAWLESAPDLCRLTDGGQASNGVTSSFGGLTVRFGEVERVGQQTDSTLESRAERDNVTI